MSHKMKKVSGSTFWSKKFFPAIWFGGVAFAIPAGLLGVDSGASVMGIIVPIVMLAIGFIIFKQLIWDLCDEVFDSGDELIFYKGDKKQHVKLRDIINVSYSHMTSPERVVITSRTDGPIGKELVFSPPQRFRLFKKSPYVAELIQRVDEARSLRG